MNIKCFAIIIAGAFISGCYEKGDCILISKVSWGEQVPFVAEYVDFSDGAWWYKVNGQLRTLSDIGAIVTSCHE